MGDGDGDAVMVEDPITNHISDDSGDDDDCNDHDIIIDADEEDADLGPTAAPAASAASPRDRVTSRVTPWADWDEWRSLKRMLATGQLRAARARLVLYEHRRRAAVPYAVHASVALASLLAGSGGSVTGADLAGEEADAAGAGMDDYLRRHALAMAIVRLVNGATDQLQARGPDARAKSVALRARRLGLPPLLVELRHLATHNALPQLPVLQTAARQALLWLETAYWQPQERAVRAQLQLVAPDDVAGDLLRAGDECDAGAPGVEDDCAQRAGFAERHGWTEWGDVRKPVCESRGDRGLAVLQRLQRATDLFAGRMRAAESGTDGVDDGGAERGPAREPGMASGDDAGAERAAGGEGEDGEDDEPAWVREALNPAPGEADGHGAECGNPEAWRNTPIGLIPGQTRVPRLPVWLGDGDVLAEQVAGLRRRQSLGLGKSGGRRASDRDADDDGGSEAPAAARKRTRNEAGLDDADESAVTRLAGEFRALVEQTG